MHIAVALGAVVLTVAGCGGRDAEPACTYDGVGYAIGDRFDVGDRCECTVDGVFCEGLDGGVPEADAATAIADAAALTCQPSGGLCAAGPPCGGGCCGAGEACVGDTCMCGDGVACGVGDTCATAGPVGLDGCGTLCCGDSGPCPD